MIKVSHKMPNFTKKQDLKVSAGLDIDWPVNAKNPNPVGLTVGKCLCIVLGAPQGCVGADRALGGEERDLRLTACLDIDWPVNAKNPNPVSW